MLATVLKGSDQELKNPKGPRSTAFAVASTMRDPTPAEVKAKVAIFEKMNAIAREEDPAKQRAAWNEVKNEYNAFKAASEGLRV